MRGSEMNADDYIWVKSDGDMMLYRNMNNWSPDSGLWETVINPFRNTLSPRKSIHIADWDGDGKCDIIIQDEASGSMHWYKNRYVVDSTTLDWNWLDMGVVPEPHCGFGDAAGGWGVGLFDRNVQFADIE
jgi:hypothetical protein